MKTLILMRHAKSSWSDAMLRDHDRPLNARGRSSAAALGDWLRDSGFMPDEILCSTAARTRETLERLALSPEIACSFDQRLYHAGADSMFQRLRAAQGDQVLMIGHNPGIADFAERLLAKPPLHERFFDYPTGATLIARFEIDSWTALRFGQGQSAAFVIPRELT